jgi:hypothetical protein
MSDSTVSVLIAVPITPAMIAPGTTIAEPDPSVGEAAWVSGGTYVEGDERTRAQTVYYCVQDHTGRTTPPENDGNYWLKKRPTNRAAPFDYYKSTAAKATGSLTFVVKPGFFTDLVLYGAVGDRVQVVVREGTGGPVVENGELDEDLWEQATGFWELMFAPLGVRDKVELNDIALHPDAELTVTITAAAASTVELGTLLVGEWRSLTGPGGGAEYGAEAEPKSYSYIKFDEDGQFEIRRRPGATDITVPAELRADQAEYAVEMLKLVQDQPVAFRATDIPGYGHLSGMGLVTGAVRADKSKLAKANFRVKGIV